MALAFNSTSIRKLSPFFYDTSHKVSSTVVYIFSFSNHRDQLKNAWEKMIDADDNDGNSNAIIEIQNWYASKNSCY